jgi:hypothetical protein
LDEAFKVIRGLLSLLTLLALTGALLPPASCMGFGQPCCCGGRGEATGGDGTADDLLSASGCNCSGPQVASCSPDAKPATPPVEQLTLRPNPSSGVLLAAVPAMAIVSAIPEVAVASASPPTARTPLLTLLCCLRV